MSRFKKIKDKIGKTDDGSYPKDQELYKKVKEEVKDDYGPDDYPSAYASAAIVKRYKKKGGEYTKPKKD